MINEGRQYIDQAAFLIFFPGIAISVSVLCLQMIGDGLRDALDPRIDKELQMALMLTNFKAIGFNQALLPRIAISDDGLVVDIATAGAEVIDCHGAYLSPGWTDLHVHV